MKVLNIIFLLILSGAAHADFVHTDWHTSGDKRATLHQETGLEWLKLNNTVSKSINQVSNEITTTYAGWRLPTGDEVELMYSSMFSPLVFNTYETIYSGDQYNIYAEKWFTWMSKTAVESRREFAYGLYVDDEPFLAGLEITFSDPTTWMTEDLDRNYTLDYVGPYGVFLVSDGGTTLSSRTNPSINSPSAANISTPSTLGGLLALFGLIFLRSSHSRH